MQARQLSRFPKEKLSYQVKKTPNQMPNLI
jgi:hypothetical protein